MIPKLLSTIKTSKPTSETSETSGTSKTSKLAVVELRTVTSWPVFCLWVSVTLCVALTSTWCYFHPAWTIRSSQFQNQSMMTQQNSRFRRSLTFQSLLLPDEHLPDNRNRMVVPFLEIGLFDICIYPGTRGRDVPVCVEHAELEFQWLPPYWKVTRVVCGASCFLLTLTAIAAMASLLIAHTNTRHFIIKYIGLLQAISGLLMLVGLCLYPFGLEWDSVSHLCNGHCDSGWSSVVTGLCNIATFLCPVLAHLVAHPLYSVNPYQSYLLV